MNSSLRIAWSDSLRVKVPAVDCIIFYLSNMERGKKKLRVDSDSFALNRYPEQNDYYYSNQGTGAPMGMQNPMANPYRNPYNPQMPQYGMNEGYRQQGGFNQRPFYNNSMVSPPNHEEDVIVERRVRMKHSQQKPIHHQGYIEAEPRKRNQEESYQTKGRAYDNNSGYNKKSHHQDWSKEGDHYEMPPADQGHYKRRPMPNSHNNQRDDNYSQSNRSQKDMKYDEYEKYPKPAGNRTFGAQKPSNNQYEKKEGNKKKAPKNKPSDQQDTQYTKVEKGSKYNNRRDDKTSNYRKEDSFNPREKKNQEKQLNVNKNKSDSNANYKTSKNERDQQKNPQEKRHEKNHQKPYQKIYDKKNSKPSDKPARREEIGDLNDPLYKEAQSNKYDAKPHTVNQLSNSKVYSVLMVAEKPSIADSIAKALCKGKPDIRKGISPMCKIHSFQGDIFGKQAHIKVTSVAGHIYNRDFPKQYASWVNTDPVTLFDAETVKVEANRKSRLVQHLKHEGKGIDFLILWLDNDREGENICFEVQSIVMNVMNKSDTKQIYRAIFSSLAEKDLKIAYKTLNRGPNRNESLSVDARQILDLKIGVAFSRFQCLYFSEKYANLNNKLITYGPCQTPTLGFCVERHLEIKNFKPEKYFTVSSTIESCGQKIVVSYKSDKRMYKKSEAEALEDKIKKNGTGKVVKVSKKESKRGRPSGLNTVEMLKHASSKLGIGPHHTMSIAERLYLSGYTTYPRTETTAYSSNFDFKSVVSTLKNYNGSAEIKEYATALLESTIFNPKKGVDVGDHPPITPTSVAPLGLGGDEARLYNFIARRFLGSISKDATFLKTKVKFEFKSDIKFETEGILMQDRGYLAIVDWESPGESLVADFKEGEVALISNTMIKDAFTKPPDYLTESELISKLEKYGIGTDASMATHINNICERNYVEVKAARKLVPTELGIALVSGYNAVDHELVAADLRSKIEGSCNKIANGEMTFEDVVKESSDLFKAKFIEFKKNIGKMDVFFMKSFTSFEQAVNKDAKVFSKCGNCGRYMDLISRFSKLQCTTCDVTYQLPRSSNYIIQGQFVCPLDNFQIISYTREDKQNTNILFKICPCCYNSHKEEDIEDIAQALELKKKKRDDDDDDEDNSDSEDDQTADGDITRLHCNQCPVETCSKSSIKNTFSKCDRCSIGNYTVHISTTYHAYLVCNSPSCLSVYHLSSRTKRAHIVASSSCDSCGRALLRLETMKNNHYHSGLDYEGCLFCAKDIEKVEFLGENYFVDFIGLRQRKGGRNKRDRQQAEQRTRPTRKRATKTDGGYSHFQQQGEAATKEPAAGGGQRGAKGRGRGKR